MEGRDGASGIIILIIIKRMHGVCCMLLIVEEGGIKLPNAQRDCHVASRSTGSDVSASRCGQSAGMVAPAGRPMFIAEMRSDLH